VLLFLLVVVVLWGRSLAPVGFEVGWVLPPVRESIGVWVSERERGGREDLLRTRQERLVVVEQRARHAVGCVSRARANDSARARKRRESAPLSSWGVVSGSLFLLLSVGTSDQRDRTREKEERGCGWFWWERGRARAFSNRRAVDAALPASPPSPVAGVSAALERRGDTRTQA
jgi:hypothetical protein